MNSLAFDKAKKHYQNIILLLNETGKQIQEIDNKFSLDVSIKQFDLILQTIMLNQVIADGSFGDEEKEFIEEIVSSADLLEYYNVCSDKNTTFQTLTWDVLQTFNKKALKIALDSINEIMEPIEDELTYFLAIVDSKTDKDEFGIFLKEITLLLSCLNIIDDEITDDEKVATVSNLMKHFVRRYQYYLMSFRKGMNV